MTPTHASAAPRLRREFLLASFAVLLVPAALLLLRSGPGTDWSFAWFLGLLPVLLWGYAFQWRGVAASAAATLGILVVVQVAATARGIPPSPHLSGVVLSFLAVAAAVAGLLERLNRDREALEDVALTDSLTALPNRRHARVFLETMFGAAERGRPVAVVLFDLDDFRSYNARMGEREGDEALKAFGALLAASTRRMNLSARLGGEEFMSILSGGDEEGARAFADRVRETFRLSRPAAREITVSAGVASFHPSMASPDELVGAADLALFRAKQEGGDRVRVFGRDVRSDEVTGVRPSTRGQLRAEGGRPPGWSHADFARDPGEMGKSAPSPDLLPPADPRYGADRSLLLVMPPVPGPEEESGDGPANLRSYLAREGFTVVDVDDAARALPGLAVETDLILADMDFLGAMAPDFIRAAKSRWPETQILALTDDDSGIRTTDGVAAGADEVLTRPVELRLLQASLVDALARRDRLLEEARDRILQPMFSEATSDEGRRLLERGLLALVRAGELRDPHTRGHARRVSRYAMTLLEGAVEEGSVGEDGPSVDPRALGRACLVHDIGKLEIAEAILVKNAPLTAEEFSKVRRHPEVGREILRPLVHDPLVLAVTGWHHERWDGSGYPDGLAGEAIPFPARIVAIVDALDAMTSPRAYREGLAWEDAVRQIRERFGSHYDPGLEPAFRRALPQLHRVYREAWSEAVAAPPEG